MVLLFIIICVILYVGIDNNRIIYRGKNGYWMYFFYY